MKQLIAIFSLAAILAGCSSPTKLDDVKVEDRTPQGVNVIPTPTDPRAGSGTVGERAVVPIDLDKSQNAAGGPNGSRVVYFDYDSYSVRGGEDQATVDSNARYIRNDRNRKVVIEGHTDERGGREYNLALGQKRAEAVRRSLTLLGVPDAQLEAVSFGKEKPAVQGSDEAAYAKNRRAEISYR
jgi:peptidoglycan-associated lipoprotein